MTDSTSTRRLTAVSLTLLAVGLAANAVLGPLVLEVIRYRFSESLLYQGIGLDFVSLVVVAPLALAAALLTRRGCATGPALGLGVGSYTAYMAVQYVVGPEYLELSGNNERFFLLHLSLLVIGLVTTAAAWSAIEAGRLSPTSPRAGKRWGALLVALGLLLLLRYAPAIAGLTAGDPTIPEYRENPTSYLLIATLDLGVFLPAIVASGAALWRGRAAARKGLHLALGWFALVGLAVAAMSTTMRLYGDPAMSVGQMVAFVAAGLVLATVYVRLQWSLFGGSTESGGGDSVFA